LHERASIRYRCIQKLQEETPYPLSLCCKVLQVARSGYYHWIHRNEARAQKAQHEAKVIKWIQQIRAEHRYCYGYRRVTKQLLQDHPEEGFSLKQIYTLAHQHQLWATPSRRKGWKTTVTDSTLPVAPNLIQQRFAEVHRPNQVWLGDLTYLWIANQWWYMAAILDLGTREIIGWDLQQSMKTDLVLNALQMALVHRRATPYFDTRRSLQESALFEKTDQEIGSEGFLIFHSDRGCQYASHAYQQALRDHHIVASMSRKGNCYDNAPMESFFHTFKQEMRAWYLTTDRDLPLRSKIFRYIEGYYNTRRLHSALNYQSPRSYCDQFRLQPMNLTPMNTIMHKQKLDLKKSICYTNVSI